MGYRRYSDQASAEEIIKKIEAGELTGYPAYRALVQIAEEWYGTTVGDAAKTLIEDEFADYE